MEKTDVKKFAPILPYDVTVAENFNIYDSFDYENNRDQTAPMLHTLETGNVVKYYTCKLTEDDFRIGIDDPEKFKQKHKMNSKNKENNQ